MRILEKTEVEKVSGGAPKWTKIDPADRAAPGADVTPELSGNRTGWCRGYGNMKDVSKGALPKHTGTVCDAASV